LEEYDNGFFNWTMSFRLDADVYLPYYGMKFVYDNVRKGKAAIDEILRRKTGIAVSFYIFCKYFISSKNVMNPSVK